MKQEVIEQLLRISGAEHFYHLTCLESTDSTNEQVKSLARQGAPEGVVITAEEQTAGKGRMGRRWVSPAGEAVYFTVLIRPVLPPEQVSAVTLVMGLSVAQAVNELCGLDVRIKWPNDVVIHGKKICGILSEAGAKDGKIEWIVVGPGINVNNRAFSEEIADRATSLRIELGGKSVEREAVFAAVLTKFAENYRIFAEAGNLGTLKDAYDEILVSKNETVRIEDPKGAYTAISRGIDESGCLIVELPDGTEERIGYGEVSVRGLYGYV